MQVTIERSGGFAGIRAVWKVDSVTLPESDAHTLRKLADACLAEKSDEAGAAMPDAFCHRISVESKLGKSCVNLQAEPLPEAAGALVEWVKSRAQ